MTTITLGGFRRSETRTGQSLLHRLKVQRAERRAMREFESVLDGASPSMRSDLLAARMHAGL
ncbi:MAG: hypothetical protein JWN57_546 [Frankiales bacterium]|jgi:hypothetical protein|nr:hypothetical protein [Frankiales bacterium]